MRTRCSFWENRLTAGFAAAAALAMIAGAAGALAGEGHDRSGDLTDLSIEELLNVTVYGASKFDQKLADAPASITIVTADDIRQYGYRTLADILEGVSGLYVSYDRNYHYLGIRGFGRPGDYNTRILLLVDGIRTNDNVFQQAAIGTDFLLDADLIERVEVIRGPSSSLYGTNAFFGIINVATRRGRDLGGAEASASAGSYRTYQGRASYGNRFDGGAEAILSGTGYASGGQDLYYAEFDDPATNNGWAVDADRDRFGSAFAKVTHGDVTLTSALVRREKNIPTAPWSSVFNDPITKTADERFVVDLKYDRAFSDRFSVIGRLSYNQYAYNGAYQYLPAFEDYARGSWWNAELQVTKRTGRHTIITGAEFRDNIHQDQETSYMATLFRDERKSLEWAVFGQDEIELGTKLLLNAGVRYDHYESFGGTTNPRVALIGRPGDKTTIKLIYGRAFRAPNAYELYYQDGVTTRSNPDVRPETIRTYEVVVDQYLGARIRGAVRGFRYVIDELITQRTEGVPPNEYLIFRNADKMEAGGAEVEVEGKWTKGLQGRISYSFQRAVDSASNERLPNSPEHVAKANLTVPLADGRLFAGIEEQYTSSRKTAQGGRAPGYWLTNLTLLAPRLAADLDLSASVYNLFDADYGDPAGEEHVQNVIPQDGRSFRAKLTYRF